VLDLNDLPVIYLNGLTGVIKELKPRISRAFLLLVLFYKNDGGGVMEGHGGKGGGFLHPTLYVAEGCLKL
jgi:hypothetical protein